MARRPYSRRAVWILPMNVEAAITAPAPVTSAPLAARISIALDLAIEAVSSALFVATIVLALIQVFFRYVLNNSLSWPDELSRFALTWMIFLGTAMVTRRARQISIDLTTRSLGPRSLAIHDARPPVAGCVPLSCCAGRSGIVANILYA
jgi:Tripartite ATP-independent periplasmic transporters, DctQ component